MKTHRYRVTIEHLSAPHADQPLDAPLVFETDSQDALMLLFISERLRAGTRDVADGGIRDTAPRRQSIRLS
jgi:hypothetical protein